MNTQSTKIPASAVPTTTEGLADWLQLARSRRVGPVTFVRLMREHGDARAALRALPAIAKDAGVSNYEIFPRQMALDEISAGMRAGARLLCLGSTDYPKLLPLINDPPPLLWARGNVALAARPCVAIVGARNASSLGRRMAVSLAADLSSAGFSVVSGLARGIDGEAHKAALSGGTIAVLAGGIDMVYPRENFQLYENIVEKGLLLSEMPMGVQPQARHFPRRNRIISGLSQALVVVEGASRSGSLITARDALDQGREVMAVPGNPFDARAAGCNMLIRDGATLIRSAKDIQEALTISEVEQPIEKIEKTPEIQGDVTAQVLALLGPTPVTEDMLIRQTGLPPERVLSTLVDLELGQKIERSQGGMVALAV